MIGERISSAGERPRIAAFLAAASLLSLLLGFRLGMNREDVVGYGLQVPAPGLDLSYTYAMNRASAEGRAFGRDFVSTYGPYGYCIAGMDVPGIVGPWIVSQLFLVLAVGLATAVYLLTLGGRPLATLIEGGLLLASIHVLADEYRWFCLVLLIALVGSRALGRGALAAFGIAGVLAGFGLLVKLSLGTGTLLTVALAALLAPSLPAVATRLAAFGVGAAAGLGLGQWQHGGTAGGLVEYLKSAAEVTGGYSSAMSLAEPDWWKAAAAFVMFAICLVVALMAPAAPRLRVVAAAFAAPVFVVWKHGLVRQDQHAQVLVFFGLVLVVLAFVEIRAAGGLRRAGPWLLLAAAALARVWFESPFNGARPGSTLAESIAQPLRLPGLAGVTTLMSLEAHRSRLATESAATLASLRLPEDARRIIGEAAVDLYPSESSYAAANDFVWRSRPSPAAFATYTPGLDRRNEAFFEGPSRPSFLLWPRSEGVRSIDRRHQFWDEPLTFRTLLDRYDSAWRGDPLLLQARPQKRFGLPRLVAKTAVDWGQWLHLPRVEGGLLMEVEIDNPLPARLRRFLLREDPAFVQVRFANGERARFRYVPDQARSGLWVEPLARNADDLADLFAGKCLRTRVDSVRFTAFRPGARGPRVQFWQVPGAAGPVFACGAG
jgi:hypothetical protein